MLVTYETDEPSGIGKLFRCKDYIFIRIIYVGINLWVPATLTLKKTNFSDLIRQFPELYAVVYCSGFVSLWLTCMALYFVICLTNPGFVEDVDDEAASDSSLETSWLLPSTQRGSLTTLLEGKIDLRYCDECERDQPLRSRHCYECGRCVRKFDHHCPWLGNCIGERNHGMFWLFLLAYALLAVWSLTIVCMSFVNYPTWGEWFAMNSWFLVDCILMFLPTVAISVLAGFHTFLMLHNSTTWERVSRKNITYLRVLEKGLNPFNRGVLRNLYWALCSFTQPRWDRMYNRHARFRDDITEYESSSDESGDG